MPSVVRARAFHDAAGSNTRRWPNRSIHRPSDADVSAMTANIAPAAAPANANEPVAARTNRTMPSVSNPTGMRATVEAAINHLSPGVCRIGRYAARPMRAGYRDAIWPKPRRPLLASASPLARYKRPATRIPLADTAIWPHPRRPIVSSMSHFGKEQPDQRFRAGQRPLRSRYFGDASLARH